MLNHFIFIIKKKQVKDIREQDKNNTRGGMLATAAEDEHSQLPGSRKNHGEQRAARFENKQQAKQNKLTSGASSDNSLAKPLIPMI